MPPRLKLASKHGQSNDVYGMDKAKYFLENENRRFYELNAAKTIYRTAKVFVRYLTLKRFVAHRYSIQQFYLRKYYDMMHVVWSIQHMQMRTVAAVYFAAWSQASRKARKAVEHSRKSLLQRAFSAFAGESATFIADYYRRYLSMVQKFYIKVYYYNAKTTLYFIHLRLYFLKSMYSGYKPLQIYYNLQQRYIIPPQFVRYCDNVNAICAKIAALYLVARCKMLLRPAFISWFLETWERNKALIHAKFVRKNAMWLYGQYFHYWAIYVKTKTFRRRYYLKIWQNYIGVCVDYRLRLHYCNKFEERHYKTWCFQAWKRYVFAVYFVAAGKILKNLTGASASFQSFDENGAPCAATQISLKRRTNIAICFLTMNDSRYRPISTAIRCIFAWKQLRKQRKSFSRFTLLIFGIYKVVRAKAKFRLWYYYARETRNGRIMQISDENAAQQTPLFDEEFVQRVHESVFAELITYDLVRALINIVRSSVGHALLTLRYNEKIEMESQALIHKYKRLILTLNEKEVEEAVSAVFSRGTAGAFLTFFWRVVIQIMLQRRRVAAEEREQYEKQLIRAEMDEAQQQSNFVFQLKAVEKMLSRRYLNYLVAVEQNFKQEITSAESCQQYLIYIFGTKNPDLAGYIQRVEGIDFALARAAFYVQSSAEMAASDIPLYTTTFRIFHYLRFDPAAARLLFTFFSRFSAYATTSIAALKSERVERTRDTKRAIASESFRNKFPPRLPYQETDRAQEWLVGTIVACLSNESSGIAAARQFVVRYQIGRVTRHSAERMCLLSYAHLGRDSISSQRTELGENTIHRADEYILHAVQYDSADEQQFINEVMRTYGSFVGDQFIDINEQIQSSNLRKMQLSKQQAERDFEFLKKSRAEKVRKESERAFYEKKKKILDYLRQNGADVLNSADAEKLAKIKNQNDLNDFIKNELAHGREIDIDDDFWKEVISQKVKDDLWANQNKDFADDKQISMSNSHSASSRTNCKKATASSGSFEKYQPINAMLGAATEKSKSYAILHTEDIATFDEKPRKIKKPVIQDANFIPRGASSVHKTYSSDKCSVDFQTENILLNAYGKIAPKVLRGKKLPVGPPQKLSVGVPVGHHVITGPRYTSDMIQSQQMPISSVATVPSGQQYWDERDTEQMQRKPSKLDLLAAKYRLMSTATAVKSSHSLLQIGISAVEREEKNLLVSEILLQNNALHDSSVSDEAVSVEALRNEVEQYIGKSDTELRAEIEKEVQKAPPAYREALIEQRLAEVLAQKQVLQAEEEKLERKKQKAAERGISVEQLRAEEAAARSEKQSKIIEQIMKETGVSRTEAADLISTQMKQLAETRKNNVKGAIAFVQKLNYFTVLEDIVADETDTALTGYPQLDRHVSRADMLAAVGASRTYRDDLQSKGRPFGELRAGPELSSALQKARESRDSIAKAAITYILFVHDNDNNELEPARSTGDSKALMAENSKLPLYDLYFVRGTENANGQYPKIDAARYRVRGTSERSDKQDLMITGDNADDLALKYSRARSSTKRDALTENQGINRESLDDAELLLSDAEYITENGYDAKKYHYKAGSVAKLRAEKSNAISSDATALQNDLSSPDEAAGASETIDANDLASRNYATRRLTSRQDAAESYYTQPSLNADVLQLNGKPDSYINYNVLDGQRSIVNDNVLSHNVALYDDVFAGENGTIDAPERLAKLHNTDASFIEHKIEEYRKSSYNGSRCASRQKIVSGIAELKRYGLLGIKDFDILLKRAASAPQTYYRIVRNTRAMEMRPFSARVLHSRTYQRTDSKTAESTGNGNQLSRTQDNCARKSFDFQSDDFYPELKLAHVPETLMRKGISYNEHSAVYYDNYANAKEMQKKASDYLQQMNQNTTQILNQLMRPERIEQPRKGNDALKNESYSSNKTKRASRVGSRVPAESISVVEIIYETKDQQQKPADQRESDAEIVLPDETLPKRNIFNDFDKLFARVGVSRLQDIVAQRHYELMRVIEQESAEDEFAKQLSELANKMMKKQAKKLRKQREQLDYQSYKPYDTPPPYNPLILSEDDDENTVFPPDLYVDKKRVLDATSFPKRTRINPNYVVFEGKSMVYCRSSTEAPILEISYHVKGKMASPHSQLRFPNTGRHARPLLLLKTQPLPGAPSCKTAIMSRIPVTESGINIVEQLEERIANKTAQQQRILQISKTFK